MRGWAAFLLALMLALCAVPAAAAAAEHLEPLRSDCHASGSLAEPLADVIAGAARWRCDAGEPGLQAERSILRFSLPATGDMRFFATRPSLFEALTLALVRDGKVIALRRYPASALRVGAHRNQFLVALPNTAAGAGADTVVAAFERPTTRGLFSDARLLPADPAKGDDAIKSAIITAMVCGMLLMPLAFNAAYYRILREKFVLWHLSISGALFIHCLLISGVVAHFVSLPVSIYARLAMLSFGAAVASAAGFCAAFIEPGKLDPRLRTALYLAVAQALVLSALHCAFPNILRSVQTPLYYASFMPILVLFLMVMVDATRRGSRAVRYQIVGWTPFILIGIVRIVSMLTPQVALVEGIAFVELGMVIESIATSLGVADRFMSIKRQRDRALSKANSLKRLSERDDLTGLYNRRALEGPYGDFAAQRFTGFALFDLDNFKRVNDTHGHAVGDAVLRTVASVLNGHDDAVALRMGGEEFLLLLRGANVSQRVERLREAIPVRIAREVTELEVLVTASAGLVEAAPEGDIGSDFVMLYRTADNLLYEAKHGGRNMLAAITLPVEQSVAAVESIAAA